MKFGKVDHPEKVDFKLPPDHLDTSKILSPFKGSEEIPAVYVGCAKWNRTDLKNFYPRGTKDELAYYSSQFNSIEMNASFYRIFPPEQFRKWKEKTPDDFKFFPKVSQDISHFKRLLDAERLVKEYTYSVSSLEEKLGMLFLQLNNNFTPKDFDRVPDFLSYWPSEFPLAMEFRHTNWFNDNVVAEELYNVLEQYNISNIITDTAGRRDLLHMRLTTPTAFIRYVGSNHPTDYQRLDDWVERLMEWKEEGVQNIYFFIHQHMETSSPLLASYFIERLNKKMKTKLMIPQQQQSLF